MKNIPYTCAVCGRACEGHINARCCPECRDEVKRSTQREGQKRRRDRQRAQEEKPAGKLTLGQIAAKARSLHMSYGEFVGKGVGSSLRSGGIPPGGYQNDAGAAVRPEARYADILDPWLAGGSKRNKDGTPKVPRRKAAVEEDQARTA